MKLNELEDAFNNQEKSQEEIDKELEQEISQFKKFITFMKQNPENSESIIIYHVIGINDEPTEEQMEHFIKEVRSDPEFGLGDFIDELKIVVLSEFLAPGYWKL